jgi:hypothetical protein
LDERCIVAQRFVTLVEARRRNRGRLMWRTASRGARNDEHEAASDGRRCDEI